MTDELEKGETQAEVPVHTMPDDSPAWALAERASWHLLDKTARDIVVMDLRGRSDVCDFFVVASGQSDVHVKALGRQLPDGLYPAGHKPKGIEGMDDGRWVLLDFFDVVVHIFQEQTREYFQLEKLWGDAPRLDLAPKWFASEAVQARHSDLTFTTLAGSDGAD